MGTKNRNEHAYKMIRNTKLRPPRLAQRSQASWEASGWERITTVTQARPRLRTSLSESIRIDPRCREGVRAQESGGQCRNNSMPRLGPSPVGLTCAASSIAAEAGPETKPYRSATKPCRAAKRRMDPKTSLFSTLSYRYVLALGNSYSAELFAIIVWSRCDANSSARGRPSSINPLYPPCSNGARPAAMKPV